MKKRILDIGFRLVNVSVVLFVVLVAFGSNLSGPLLKLNLYDYTKSPLPPYRDSIARAIKNSAAIYFSIIEGATPYNARIKAPENFVQLSKDWYAQYFLLDRQLISNCNNCDFSITVAPSTKEATDSSNLYTFVITKN